MLRVMKIFHLHKLKFLFRRSVVARTLLQELPVMFCMIVVQKTFTQNKLIRLNILFIELIDFLNEKYKTQCQFNLSTNYLVFYYIIFLRLSIKII